MQHELNVTSTVVIAKDAGMRLSAFIGDDSSLSAFLAKVQILGIALSATQRFPGGVMPMNATDVEAIKACPLFDVVECEDVAAARGQFATLNKGASPAR